MKYVAIYLMACISAIGCKSKLSDDKDVAYFGGEVINPKSETVILYSRTGNLNDTLKLDKNNRFVHQIKNVESGVFYFRHGDQVQMVIIEPEDSIMFRLNTYDFDESLVYTGKGARKNNYLLDTFLRNEKENHKLIKHSQLDPEKFNTFINKRQSKNN